MTWHLWPTDYLWSKLFDHFFKYHCYLFVSINGSLNRKNVLQMDWNFLFVALSQNGLYLSFPIGKSELIKTKMGEIYFQCRSHWQIEITFSPQSWWRWMFMEKSKEKKMEKNAFWRKKETINFIPDKEESHSPFFLYQRTNSISEIKICKKKFCKCCVF